MLKILDMVPQLRDKTIASMTQELADANKREQIEANKWALQEEEQKRKGAEQKRAEDALH